MATMIEMLGAKAVDQNTKSPLDGVSDSFQGGLKTAVGLAQAKQSMDAQRQQMEQQKYELQQKQMTGMLNGIKGAAFAQNPKIQKAALDRLDSQANAYGVAFDRQGFEAILSDPSLSVAVKKGLSDLTSGKQLANPEEFFSLIASQPAMLDWAMNQQNANSNVANKYEQQLAIAQTKMDAQAKMFAAKQTAAAEKTDKKETKDQSKALFDVKTKFDAAVKDDVEALGNANKAAALLAAGGTVSGSAAQSTIARMFEKGVLTDADLNRLSGGKSLYDRGAQLAQFAVDGKLTEDNKKELLRIVNTLTPVFEKKIADRAEREVESASKIWKDIPKERFQEVLTSPAVKTPSAGGSPPPAPKKPDIAAGVAKARAAGRTDAQIETFLIKQGLDAMAIQAALKGE